MFVLSLHVWTKEPSTQPSPSADCQFLLMKRIKSDKLGRSEMIWVHLIRMIIIKTSNGWQDVFCWAVREVTKWTHGEREWWWVRTDVWGVRNIILIQSPGPVSGYVTVLSSPPHYRKSAGRLAGLTCRIIILVQSQTKWKKQNMWNFNVFSDSLHL